MRACECRSSLHGPDGCGVPAEWRWHFPPEHTLPSEPGHIDLCKACKAEWRRHGLSPTRTVKLHARLRV